MSLEGAPPLVKVTGVTKRFGAITALNNVSIAFRSGEVHGLVGANGAGKSTLVKILAGAYAPDQGTVEVDGEPVVMHSTLDSRRLGLEFIYQELSLVPKFSVLQNLAMGNWKRSSSGLLTWRELRGRAREVLDIVGLSASLDEPAGHLSVADGWLVSIGRALMRDARLIAMDEPSASLSAEECDRLFGVVRELVSSGVAVVYVSHRLDEVVDLCKTVTVFRDGRVVDTLTGDAITKPALVHGIVGDNSTLPELAAQKDAVQVPNDLPVLSVRGLCRGPLVHGVDLDVMPGEVVGLTGLVGSGRTEVVRMIFGADRPEAGEMFLDGKPYRPHSIPNAIRAGVALVPEERRSQGLFLDKSIDFNISLPTLSALQSGPFRLLSSGRRAQQSGRLVKEMGIKTRSIQTPVRQLSGGNQQKVVMAKWLAGKCKLLLLDEASRGVDVSARAEIYAMIRRQAALGTAVIVISSEFDEMVNCDRVVVLREGRVVAELGAGEISESAILAASFADSSDIHPIELSRN